MFAKSPRAFFVTPNAFGNGHGDQTALRPVGTLLVSHDGMTFEPKPLPAPQVLSTDMGPVYPTRGDLSVATRADGRVYVYCLLQAPQYTVGNGLEVMWSDDDGATWAGQQTLTLAEASNNVESDRPWLGIGLDGELALTYQQVPSGIWMSLSHDGGQTWSAFNLAASNVERVNLGAHGHPVFDGDDVVFPAASMYGYVTERIPVVSDSIPYEIRLYRTSDGLRFTSQLVATVLGHDPAVFPQMAKLDDGRLVVA